ncbi:formate dehydrogenase [Arsenicitalea aurantiaca]|uniref:Formate dehydrogenase n=1 Tax=Arsenicitalea aurantiaca TaxID=1783274 RepID=A0A433XB08_9HYPH|nr:FdhF/YdeP family oxidoreductase [Arsenicitalea aurantiaca]RUT31281.1 formate dehydrogenase [Arsenicitalea aurantiaca]
MSRKIKIEPYKGPAGGWGSMHSVARHMKDEGMLVRGAPVLAKQNKPDGFACVSCAWAKPDPAHPAEFCENGAKATFWELTSERNPPEAFLRHTVSEMRGWSDYELEKAGRLTHPMRFNHETDRYEAVGWDEAFAEIGAELAAIRQQDPKGVVFYTSGRASLETSYMYQLFARLYGNNNLPDSSNMCHESTSVALPESIGVAVGTVTLEHFEKADALFFFGQNVGSNSPRMLHQLEEAKKRGAAIVSFNPLRERGLERFTNPQDPVQMATRGETRISDAYHQVRPGGDIAVLAGMSKWLFEADLRATADGEDPVLDHDFLAEHTHGLSAFRDFIEALDWNDLEREAGLSRDEIEAAARIYASANGVIGVYGMGLTQHRLGVDTVQMLVNLLLLRGNVGKDGAGICPVRGHSNVQGQRTVGISEKPELVPLDRLAEQYGFEPPREEGMSTVDACRGIIEGRVSAFLGLGGNFLRAVPERELMEANWPRMRLNVQIATKLNRSHLFNGKRAYLLPCLGRTEHDEQATGPQVVTIEDSTSCIRVSKPVHPPASEMLRSEPAIVAGIAMATLPDNPNVPWRDWVGDYARIREAIAGTYPDIFHDFNTRMFEKGGFRKPVPADERVWKTDTGRANFKLPKALGASFDNGNDDTVLRLITLRSNDQFNTTVYGYRDRFRGIEGTRMVVLLNGEDMERFGIRDGEMLGMETAVGDGVIRRMSGFRATRYDIPKGSCGAYYPECNALVPLWQYAEKSKVPAAKSVPVRLLRDLAHA